MTFKDLFSGHSDLYVRARPHYPEALFDWIAAEAPAHTCAWDAGCGNGQASVALAARFERVIATDPSERQLGNAVASVAEELAAAWHAPEQVRPVRWALSVRAGRVA